MIVEASDGLQAVEQADELQPDLILLDLALPKLNGMDAARRIRKVSPHSEVIFRSQDSCPEIVQAALRLGAHGYLLKSDATELPLAIDAVLKGAVFVSRRLKCSCHFQPPHLMVLQLMDSYNLLSQRRGLTFAFPEVS